MKNYYCSECGMVEDHRKITKCFICGSDLKYLGKKIYGGYSKPQIHAMFETEDGKQVPVDKKGNVVENNVYENDERGWKRAGKKIKDRKVYFK